MLNCLTSYIQIMEMSRQLLLAVSGVYVRRSCPSVFSLLWREGGWRGEAAASHDPAHVAGLLLARDV